MNRKESYEVLFCCENSLNEVFLFGKYLFQAVFSNSMNVFALLGKRFSPHNLFLLTLIGRFHKHKSKLVLLSRRQL